MLQKFHAQISEDLEHINHIIEELNPLWDLKQRRRRLTGTTIVLLSGACVYLLLTIPQGLLRPQGNALFAFLFVGLILTIVNYKETELLVVIDLKFPALFNVTQSPFINRLVKYATIVIVMTLLFFLNYYIILYILYLFLYSFLII